MELSELGKFLQKTRRARGIRLKDIAAETKILPRILKAIEEGDREELPEEPYLRAFLRVYAHYVGLDEEEVINQYEGTASPPPPVEEEEQPPKRPFVPILVICLAIVAVTSVILLSRREMTSPPPNDTPELLLPSNEEEMAFSDTMEVQQVTSPEEIPIAKVDTLTLAMVGIESTWVSVTVDGGRPSEVIIGPAQRITWHAEDGYLLTLGKGDGVELWLNDRKLKRFVNLRRSRVVKNLVLDRETVKGLVEEE